MWRRSCWLRAAGSWANAAQEPKSCVLCSAFGPEVETGLILSILIFTFSALQLALSQPIRTAAMFTAGQAAETFKTQSLLSPKPPKS